MILKLRQREGDEEIQGWTSGDSRLDLLSLEIGWGLIHSFFHPKNVQGGIIK